MLAGRSQFAAPVSSHCIEEASFEATGQFA
jgi:hypothetical protein